MSIIIIFFEYQMIVFAFSDSSTYLKPVLASSHRRCFLKICFTKFRNTQRKTPVLESRFNKVYCYINFIKKRLQHRYFPMNTVKCLRTPILKNICERLLLNVLMITKTSHWFAMQISWMFTIMMGTVASNVFKLLGHESLLVIVSNYPNRFLFSKTLVSLYLCQIVENTFEVFRTN